VEAFEPVAKSAFEDIDRLHAAQPPIQEQAEYTTHNARDRADVVKAQRRRRHRALLHNIPHDPPDRLQPVMGQLHFYEQGHNFIPYPGVATQMSAIATDQGVRPAEVFRAFDQVRVGMPPALNLDPAQLGQLHSAANLDIAEGVRDPAMPAMNSMAIRNAMATRNVTAAQVFGRKRPGQQKGNDPGTLPASGTGAERQFAAVRRSIETGESTDAASVAVTAGMSSYRNAKKMGQLKAGARDRRVALLKEFAEQARRTKRAEKHRQNRRLPGDWAQLPENSAENDQMRAASSLRRDLAVPSGLLAHNLRPLADPAAAQAFVPSTEPLAHDDQVGAWFEKADALAAAEYDFDPNPKPG
jgi:hypothetical protein